MERKAILAGCLITIGDMAILVCDNKYLAALLFSFALMTIIDLGLPLYTGRIGKVIVNKNPFECIKILFWNIYGVALFTLLFLFAKIDYIDKIIEISKAKFDIGLLALFFSGFLCNVLVHIAVTAKKNIITVLCVMTFIICGFEHSIADFMYLAMYHNLIGWLVILAGNTVGGIFTEFLLLKIGVDDSDRNQTRWTERRV